MYCRHCGKEILNGSRFCSYCGASQTGQDTQAKPKSSTPLIICIALIAVVIIVLFISLSDAPAEKAPSAATQETVYDTPITLATLPTLQKSNAANKTDEITYEYLDCQWADESYHFGNGGQAAILEFTSTVKNCRSFTFYLEVEGNYGAHFNGTWKIFVRSHGKWVHVSDINFQEPDGYFDITLDSSRDFDAITAYPTIQGNASYSVYFNIYDVHCRS